MTDDHTRPTAGDEPPLVAGALIRASREIGRVVRGILTRIDRAVLIGVWAAGAVVIFVSILVLSVLQSPGAAGVASGLFAGLFAALLYAAAFGWLLLWARRSTRRTPAAPAAAPHAVDAALASTLQELERTRAEVIGQVKRRSVTRVPAGVAAAVLIWVLSQWGDDPAGIFELVLWVGVGALAGEMWAIGTLDGNYRRLYKQRVLPHLARRFGDLTYRRASAHDVGRLKHHRILPEFSRAAMDDEIAGTHRGLPVSIVEARLECGSGDNKRVVFDGVLVDLTLPRRLTATTAVMPDAGLVGNLRTAWRSNGLQRVSLEDPQFEKRYEVYGTDQVEARALLTPAFMERFMALGNRAGLAAPGALAEGNRLIVALPKSHPVDLFEPPPYWKASGARTLAALSDDIGAVLRMADAVVDLDFWARAPRA